MSVNQSRGADKNEFKRSGRSGNPNSPRNYPGGGGGKGGGGGGTTTAPPSGTNFYSGNKCFKKVVANNAQGAQNRGPGSNPNVNSNYSSGGGRGAPNGPHNLRNAARTSDVSSAGAPAKLADSSVQKSSPGLPKAPQSHPASHSSGTTGATGSTTPAKGSGDASRAFPLQFGSINPGVMNGMQVPARTNSASPNLDEQTRAQLVTHSNIVTIILQARLDSLKAAAYQNQAAPKQHLTRNMGIIHPNQGLTFSPQMAQLGNMGMGPGPQYPQQSMGNLNFGGARRTVKINHPDTHEELRLDKRTDGYLNGGTSGSRPHPHGQPQSQAVPSFTPSHPINYYPGYNLNPLYFPAHGRTQSTSGSQAPRFYNQKMGPGPQYPQQSMGNLNFGGARRTVKIFHPNSHEELRLDKRTDG